MPKIRVTKGCRVDLPLTQLEVKVSIYNTGFYIYTNFNGIPDTTTRNTPEKVLSYIGKLLALKKIDSEDVIWYGDHKVITDSNGFFKTTI